MHGYDVLDHTRISEEAGGREAFERLVTACREAGLGIIVDVVPEPHDGARSRPTSTRRSGRCCATARRSPYAGWFDVDWVAEEDRILMPVLGGTRRAGPRVEGSWSLADDGGPTGSEHVLRYYDAEFPVAPGTEDAAAARAASTRRPTACRAGARRARP